MVRLLLGIMSVVPLSVLYFFGAWGGKVAYRFDQKFARMIQENAAQAGYDTPGFYLENAAQAGRGGAELVHLWSERVRALLPLVKVTGWERVEQALAQGKGMVLLTPHMGSFEMLSLWIGTKIPFMAMYRQPKVQAVEAAMIAGRERLGVQMATADLKGIRMLLKHLKKGHMLGLLPDQVPGHQGEFVLADWFGKSAKTMTLPVKLLQQSGAGLVLAFGKRVNASHRFELYFEVIDPPNESDIQSDVQWINMQMERLIRMAPEQYVWSYNRYKGADEIILTHASEVQS